jgi:hypothetical protein
VAIYGQLKFKVSPTKLGVSFMGLVKAVVNGLSNRHAPSSIATRDSTLGLNTSATAMEALRTAGNKDSVTIARLTKAIAKPSNLDQGATNALSAKAGAVTNDYQKLKSIAPVFDKAMNDAQKAAELRSKMAAKAAQTGQKIAVLNAKTQAEIGWGHQAAHAETNYYQSAYGGGNFSV